MARKETRAESSSRLRSKASRTVHAGLKARGIVIPEIDGASDDDSDLRNLQEWQALERAFDDAEKSAQAGNPTWNADSAVSGLSADTMDSGKPASPKPGKGL